MAAILRDHVRYVACAPNRSFREGPHLARLMSELVNRNPGQFRLVYHDRMKIPRTTSMPSPRLSPFKMDLSYKPNLFKNRKVLVSINQQHRDLKEKFKQ